MNKSGISIISLILIFTIQSCVTSYQTSIEKTPETARIENYLGESEGNAIQYQSKEEVLILFPFQLITYTAEYHIIAFFDGHDTYESLEAFIFPEDDTGRPIRAILTKHDNTQVDFINRENMDSPIRECISSEITFEYHNHGKAAVLSFTDNLMNDWRLNYRADYEVSKEWGGLIDVEGHSPDSSMPLFCYDLAGIASEGTFVSENEKRYSISVDQEASKPPYFTAYQAYVSEGYNAAIFRTGVAIELLERFIFENGVKQAVYDHDGIKQTAELEWNGSIPEIRSISASSILYSPVRSVKVEFNPPLPNLHALPSGEEYGIRFSISFDSTLDVVYGDITLRRIDEETVELRMEPAYPAWVAQQRRMQYQLTEEKGQLQYSIIVQ